MLTGLVVGVSTTLAVKWWLEARIDTLGFGGEAFALVSWACGLLGGLGAALATSGDPEVRCRAEDIVAAIDNKLHPEHRLTGHTSEVCRVSVSADGKRLLTSSTDKTLRLWDTDTGKELCLFKGHTECILGAAI